MAARRLTDGQITERLIEISIELGKVQQCGPKAGPLLDKRIARCKRLIDILEARLNPAPTEIEPQLHTLSFTRLNEE